MPLLTIPPPSPPRYIRKPIKQNVRNSEREGGIISVHKESRINRSSNVFHFRSHVFCYVSTLTYYRKKQKAAFYILTRLINVLARRSFFGPTEELQQPVSRARVLIAAQVGHADGPQTPEQPRSGAQGSDGSLPRGEAGVRVRGSARGCQELSAAAVDATLKGTPGGAEDCSRLPPEAHDIIIED